MSSSDNKHHEKDPKILSNRIPTAFSQSFSFMKMEFKSPQNYNEKTAKWAEWDVVTVELAWCIVLCVEELAVVGLLARNG